MGLFDKKYCDICGEKIGLLGNRKLDNGNQIVSALTGVPAPAYGNMISRDYPQQGTAAPCVSRQMAGDKWVCSCGATNTGHFCEYCGTPKP